MKMVSRFFAFIVVVMMAMTAFVGCTSSTNTPAVTTALETAMTSESNAPTSSEPTDPYAEKVSFSMISSNPVSFIQPQNTPTQQLIEQKFNVAIEVIQIDLYDTDQWNLFWASGKTADYSLNVLMGNRASQLINQGLVRDIPPDMVEKFLPTWIANCEVFSSKQYLHDKCYFNDKLYMIPYTNFIDAAMFVESVRTDWMANVGITNFPTTLDEYHDLLYKFVHNDPDKNGKDDTFAAVPFALPLATSMPYYIWQAFDIYPQSYFFKDGNLTYSDTTENYKQLLKTMNAWYNEGLFDPEFITDKRADVRKKWFAGKIGVYPDSPWWYDESIATNLVKQLTDAQPDATLDYLLPPEVLPEFKGTGGGYPQMFIDPTNYAMLYGAKASDSVLERTMQMAEALVVDFDWYVRINYGEKDVNYTIDKNGTYVLNADMTDEAMAKSGIGLYFGSSSYNYEFFKGTHGNIPMKVFEVSQKIPAMLNRNGVSFSSAIQTKYQDQLLAISDLSKTYYYNAVSGRLNIDESWDSFINDLKKAGLDEILALKEGGT